MSGKYWEYPEALVSGLVFENSFKKSTSAICNLDQVSLPIVVVSELDAKENGEAVHLPANLDFNTEILARSLKSIKWIICILSIYCPVSLYAPDNTIISTTYSKPIFNTCRNALLIRPQSFE